MTLKDFFKREKHVALHAQSRQFRIRKYITLLVIVGVIYFFKGWDAVGYSLLFGAIAGVCLHFFFRWKTQGWTKSWGLYKRIPLDGE